jgi:hypothetical protein
VFDWAEEHNAKFGLDKFQLVDFTRKRRVAGYRLNGTPIRVLDVGDPI